MIRGLVIGRRQDSRLNWRDDLLCRYSMYGNNFQSYEMVLGFCDWPDGASLRFRSDLPSVCMGSRTGMEAAGFQWAS